MARPLSPEKRSAILDAATEVVGTLGVSAPTAAIAKKAGVAEGTLFTYFANKDELLNALYVALKMDLGAAVGGGYPATKGLEDRSRFLWEAYICWGSGELLKHQAMRQLAVSGRITDESRQAGREALGTMRDLIRECSATAALKGHPPAYTSSIMAALAEMTLDHIAGDPSHAKRYIKTGFAVFWRAIGR